MESIIIRLIKRISRYKVRRIVHDSSDTAIRRRTKYYSRLFKTMGQGCKIKAGCIIDNPEKIEVGNGVSIQYNCYLSAFGGITIGDDTGLGNGTKIFTTEHPYDNSGKPFRYNALKILPVTIGNNVITGANVIILGGVHVGNNVIIGAGSVVTKDIPSNSVYAGNPAKLIKKI